MFKNFFKYAFVIGIVLGNSFLFLPQYAISQTPEPIVHDYDIQGITVKITELKRTGDDIVTLRWVYINNTDQPIELADSGNPYLLGKEHYLLDLKDKKQYEVLTTNGYPLGRKHGDKVVVAPKSEYAMWVRFPAPPKDVKAIDVYIDKVGEPFEKVTITE
ncbi:MAG: hypothetical protein K1X44_02285 [Alphaproteobacteria bacterium]|nr:hypothetical protein [Alphaproteobacteria bacterium]